MDGEGHIRQRVNQTIFEHEAGTVVALLARLKHKHHRSGQFISAFAQGAGSADQHGYMGVVTTGMHRPDVARQKVQASVFGQGKRIHIAAQEHGAPVGRAAQGSDQTRG